MNNNLPIKIQLPESFFLEEERNGHLVTTQMKEIWAVELDLLSEFVRVCTKYHLKWFADSGTLLGAVRHNGFIPWDDDTDVSMFRDDYEKLCEVAPNEFKYPYFWATALTNRGAVRGYAQLQNDLTTAIQVGHQEKKFSFHQGIFLDIFPLDNVPADKSLRDTLVSDVLRQQNRIAAIAGCTFMYRPHRHEGAYRYVKHWLKHIAYEILQKHKQYVPEVNKWYSIMKRYNGEKTEDIVQIMMPNVERQMVKLDWYDHMEWMPFENMQIAVPNGWQHVLENFYGDWHKMIRGGSMHECFFDTRIPYTEYIK